MLCQGVRVDGESWLEFLAVYYLIKGGATIVIGETMSPILMSAETGSGTKLLGDPILHMH